MSNFRFGVLGPGFVACGVLAGFWLLIHTYYCIGGVFLVPFRASICQ